MTPARRGKRLMAEINVVPYIDVMLVLLIIFMITAPMLTQGIKVELPKAGAEPLPQDMSEQQLLILGVDKSGNFYLNIGKDEETPIDDAAVVDRVSAVLRRDPKTGVLVKADRSVPYGRVVEGMVLLQQAGAEKVGFVTDPADAKRAQQKKQ
ncbi:biopolymer transport protein TolR [Povalibacter uvarum]|uniref:Tol-Pal system protein TolR n=1 Tax=Povalibacter uvarum TaxID=732238 RepID=A0A841HGH8_9GAMM|nr:protein TolR [Povalibacter uvarum]MBB6092221.1 biopolymer transport protein TolR [Povalibacter uvarum]